MLETANVPEILSIGGGAKFWVYISGQRKTPELLTKWSVKFEHTTSNWFGVISSDNPTQVLETPNLSGIFKVYVRAAGTEFEEKLLEPFDYSRSDIGCSENCMSMVGIAMDEQNEKVAKYWTVWDAIQTKAAGVNGKFGYEYLHYYGSVHNYTNFDMDIIYHDISWGKWAKPPLAVKANTEMKFEAQGRAHSASGTEGTIKWSFNDGRVSPEITLYFDHPYSGSSSESITINHMEYTVNKYVVQSGNSRIVNFWLENKK